MTTEIDALMAKIAALESQVADLTAQLAATKPAAAQVPHPGYTDEQWEAIKAAPRVQKAPPLSGPGMQAPGNDNQYGGGGPLDPGSGPGRPVS